MVRHPFDRLKSAVAHWQTIVDDDALFKESLQHDLQRAEPYTSVARDKHAITFERMDDALFIIGILQLQDICDDIERSIAHGVEQVITEQLVSDREYFKGVVRRLTQEKISISNAYLNRVFSLSRINEHRSKASAPDDVWPQWKCEAYNQMLANNGDRALNIYRELGYEIAPIKSMAHPRGDR